MVKAPPLPPPPPLTPLPHSDFLLCNADHRVAAVRELQRALSHDQGYSIEHGTMGLAVSGSHGAEMNGPLLSSLLSPDVILGKPAFSCTSPSSSPYESACDLIICASFISAWQLLEALTMPLHQMTHQWEN